MARTAFDTWLKANSSTTDPANAYIKNPKETKSASILDENTPLARGWYIAIFSGMWLLMAFPLIADVVIVAAHYSTTFTPSVPDVNAIMSTTQHKEFYMANVYKEDMAKGEAVTPEWNAWTVWNTAQLCLSILTFGFYAYIGVAIVIAVQDGYKKYDSATSLL